MNQRHKLIFTLTTGHAGGTLLNLLLGTSPAVFAAGECLRVTNLKSLPKQPKATQDFWRPAVERLAAEGWPAETIDDAFVNTAPIAFWRLWLDLVAAASPRPVIADKTLSLALIEKICRAGLVEPFFVHLVRDPRAVTYAFQKKYSGNFIQGRTWNKSHRAIERFLAEGAAHVRLRYEDLVLNPTHLTREILSAASARFGLDLLSALPDDLERRTMDDAIFENVIFAGNRMRHDENRVDRAIEIDNSFLDALPDRHWFATNAFCWLRLSRYGYGLTRSQARLGPAPAQGICVDEISAAREEPASSAS